MSKGRHAKPSNNNKRIALGASAILGGSVVVPVALAGSANAATAAEWDAVAKCESGGRWNLSWGHADSTGGLQIQDRTWADFGGTAIAPHAYQATKEQQIQIAEKILAVQGPRAWSVTWNGTCPGATLSNTPYATDTNTTPATPPTPAPPTTPTPPPTSTESPDAEDGVYVVKPGDYLVKIASTLKIEGGWKALYEINKEVIGPNPNLIQPGQKLRLPGHEAPPAADPYKDGLPKVGSKTPSAKPLQAELKRVGILDEGIPSNDNYGPATRSAVSYFHKYHPQFRSPGTPWAKDVQIGREGWQHLRTMAPMTGATAPKKPVDTPPSPAPSGYVMPVTGRIGDGLIIGSGGSMSRSAGGHSGLDIMAPQGTPVKSVAAGTVVSKNSSGGAYGLHVVVKHADGKYTLYAHLSATTVSVGQSVNAGQQVGNVGSTGNSSGAHLHFEVRTHPTDFSAGVFLNPVAYLRSHGVSI